jgi:hypothetical protein
MKDCQITSIFSARSTSVVRKTKLSFPDILKNVSANHLHVCSCDGILCFSTEVGTLAGHSVVLWNPSIRKFNVFPPLENQDKGFFCCSFSFGYAHLTHTCKIVSVSFFHTEKITQVVAVASGSYIVSLDLEKESYRKILKPDVGTNHCTYLGSVEGFFVHLCNCKSTERFVDVWIMKEYENEESWTKLYRVPHWRDLI